MWNRRLTAALLMCATLSHVTAGASDELCEVVAYSTANQITSLENIYYTDTPLPPGPTPGQKTWFSLRKGFGGFSGHERKLLETVFSDRQLRILATRDSDDDGVLDYRINCGGKFLENDTDVDGDGILNVFDAEPYAPGGVAADTDQDGVPDHIDWTSHESQLADLQQSLFQDHGVLMVERSGAFTKEMANAVNDLALTVFRTHLNKCEGAKSGCNKGMRALSYVAADQAGAEEIVGGILAEVVGPTGAMIIYTDRPGGMTLEELFSTLAHEMMHNYQFNLDQRCAFPWSEECGDAGFRDMKLYNRYRSPEFIQEIETASESKWKVGDFPEDDLVFRHVVYHPYEVAPQVSFDYSDDQLADWWYELNQDPEKYWAKLGALNLVGEYSLTDPFEWQAEHMIAYIFLGMEKYARASNRHAPQDLERLEACFGQRMQKVTDNIFYHRPAKDTNIMKWFGAHFPMSEEDWAYLYDRYLARFYRACADKN